MNDIQQSGVNLWSCRWQNVRAKEVLKRLVNRQPDERRTQCCNSSLRISKLKPGSPGSWKISASISNNKTPAAESSLPFLNRDQFVNEAFDLMDVVNGWIPRDECVSLTSSVRSERVENSRKDILLFCDKVSVGSPL